MIDVSGQDKRLDDVKEIKKMGLPIFVWGGQHTGEIIKEYLYENGINRDIKTIVDDEYYCPGEQISLSYFLDHYSENAIVVFGFYNYKIIQNKRIAYSEKIKHFFDFHFTSIGNNRLKWNKQDVIHNMEGYRRTYEMLKDKKSKRTMELYLRAAVNGEFDQLFNECHSDISYFNDITKEQKVDILVDCGAFDGDSIHDFVSVFHDYENIYAFEPDSGNRKRLKERINDEVIRNVEIVPYGAYKESTTLFFSNEGDSASHVDDKGVAIEVTTIDEYVKDSFIGKRGLIKMDIEGSEMDALEGAKGTIINFHPCLTICVYHKERDLIDIPHYISSLVGEGVYNYYLGFHGLDLAELVLYALPREG